METISWTDRVKNEEVLQKVDEGSVLRNIQIRKLNTIGHSLHRKCVLKHSIEGKMRTRIEVTGR
jgi:hypothetical protein